MMDQCKFCEHRGDLKECEAGPCGHHENWYPLTLKENLTTATDALKAILQYTTAEDKRTFIEKTLKKIGV